MGFDQREDRFRVGFWPVDAIPMGVRSALVTCIEWVWIRPDQVIPAPVEPTVSARNSLAVGEGIVDAIDLAQRLLP